MRKTGRLSRIEQIRAIINTPPPQPINFYMIEDKTIFCYDREAKCWKPGHLNKSGKDDMLFKYGSDVLPGFAGHVYESASLEEMQEYWNTCKLTDAERQEITQQYKDKGLTVREFADEMIKLFNT